MHACMLSLFEGSKGHLGDFHHKHRTSPRPVAAAATFAAAAAAAAATVAAAAAVKGHPFSP